MGGRSQLHIEQLRCDATHRHSTPPCPGEALGTTVGTGQHQHGYTQIAVQQHSFGTQCHSWPEPAPEHWESALAPSWNLWHSTSTQGSLCTGTCAMGAVTYAGESPREHLYQIHTAHSETRQGSTSTSSPILSTSALLLKGSLGRMGKAPEPPQPSSPFQLHLRSKHCSSPAHYTGAGWAGAFSQAQLYLHCAKPSTQCEQLSGMHEFTLIC